MRLRQEAAISHGFHLYYYMDRYIIRCDLKKIKKEKKKVAVTFPSLHHVCMWLFLKGKREQRNLFYSIWQVEVGGIRPWLINFITIIFIFCYSLFSIIINMYIYYYLLLHLKHLFLCTIWIVEVSYFQVSFAL